MRDLKYILRYAKPYRKSITAAVLLVFAECIFEMAIPLLMTDIVDIGVANRDVAFLLRQGGLMILCAFLALATGLAYARFAASAANGLGAEIRAAEYKQTQKYDFANLDRFSAPSLITRMTTDVTVLQNTVNTALRPMVRGPVMLVLGVGLAFILNGKLALVFIVSAPILGAVLAFIVHKVGPLYNRQQTSIDNLNRAVQEDLTAIRTVKAFAREDLKTREFDVVNKELNDISLKTFKNAVLNLPSFQIIMYTVIVCIMWYGGNFILIGNMSVGELTAFLSYVLQVLNSVMMISNVFLMMTRSLASAKRVRELLEEAPSLEDPDSPAGEVKDGSIDFENVSFKYDSAAEKFALSDINLHIPSGATVGIIGGTGSAKSTFAQLIPRLYDATVGTVKVGGRNVKDYDLATLRDAVGLVPQKSLLFSGTIKENLLWGNPAATDREIEAACEAACVDEFIDRMPKGLDTYLGQGGVNVSGGQKQRLCIARALLKRPKILILDDSVSAVDTATEAKIREATAKLKDMTKIIIAQRISAVKDADIIAVMEHGKIRAAGKHEELLKKDSVYQEIYYSQMKGAVNNGEAV